MFSDNLTWQETTNGNGLEIVSCQIWLPKGGGACAGDGSMSKKSADISTENPDFQLRRWRQQQSECRIRPSLQTSNFHQCLSLLRRQNPKPMLKKGRNVLVSTRTPRRKWCIRGGKTGLYCTLNFKHEDGLNKCTKQMQKTMNCACPWLSSTLLPSPPISPTCPPKNLFTHNFCQSKKPTIFPSTSIFSRAPLPVLLFLIHVLFNSHISNLIWLISCLTPIFPR